MKSIKHYIEWLNNSTFEDETWMQLARLSSLKQECLIGDDNIYVVGD